MNYGLTKMQRGDFAGALADYTRAAIYAPNYFFLEINTRIDLAAVGRSQEAEPHFRRAIELQPNEAQTYYFDAIWPPQQGRIAEAIQNAKTAVSLNPAYIDASHLRMNLYAQQGQRAALQEAAQNTLKLVPGDPGTLAALNRSSNMAAQLAAAAVLLFPADRLHFGNA
jgi:tetratricopeptide (TPR) repeat protein